MNKHGIQVDKFLIYDPDKSQSTGNVFISHPTPVEEETFGKLLIITDIHSQDRINQDVINTIQEELKKHYYQSSDLNIETAFENALQKTNDKLHQLIQDGLANWVDKLNIIIAVIKDNQMHITQIGSLHAYLIHGPKIVDILEISETPAELEINPLKIFSNIISGQLNPGDYVLFCTASLLDFISLEKMKRTIFGSRPQDSAAYIENLLIDTNQKTTFAAIIAQAIPDTADQKQYMPLNLEHSEYSAPQVSMDEMHSREQKTSELMTPSIWPVIKKSISSITGKTKGLLNGKVLQKPSQDKPYPEKLRPALKPRYTEQKDKNIIVTILLFIWRFIKGIFVLLGKVLIGFFKFFKNFKESRQQVKNLPDKIAHTLAKWINQFLSLTASRKILLLIAFLLIFAFAQSIVTLGEGQEKEKTTTEYSQVVIDIEQKQAEIDASLIYGDDQKAFQLLNEARSLLAQLPDKKQYRDTISQFNQSLQQRADKINHVVEVTEPTELYDFATAEEGASVRGMVQIRDKIFAFNPNNNSIYGFDLESKETDIVTNTTEEIGNLQLRATPEDNNYITYYTNADKVVRFSLSSSEFEERDINFANQDKTIKYIESYAGRLYVLDTKNNAIFRHNNIATGYAEGASWVQDDLDLTDATALTVDGNIYVLKANGEIWKLTQGRKQDLAMNQIEPAFNNPTSLFTKTDSEKIYVLDPENNRLVIFNKQGKLINQYRSDQFDGLKDFIVSDDENTIYLLNKTRLYSFDLATE